MKVSNEEKRLERAVEAGIGRWFSKIYFFLVIGAMLGIAGSWAYQNLPWFTNLADGAFKLEQSVECHVDPWLRKLFGGSMAKSTFVAPKQEGAPVPIPTPPLKVTPPRYPDIGSEGCVAQIKNQREWDQLPVGAYFYDSDGTLKQRNAKPTDLLDGVRGSKLHPYNIETDEEFAQLKPGDWYLDCRPPHVPPAGIGLGGKHNPYDVWDNEYFKRIPRGAWYIDDRPGHRNKNSWEPKQKD